MKQHSNKEGFVFVTVFIYLKILLLHADYILQFKILI